jgi:phage-related protein
MPTFPLSPAPRSTTLAGVQHPQIVHRVDDGYELRRSRYTRGTRRYRLEYIVTTADFHVLQDFVYRETANGVLSVEWTFPYPHRIVSITAATPNVVTTVATHGYQTGDMVEISSTPTQNGTHTITRIGATTCSLDGSAGGTPATEGFVALYFPVMLIRLPDGEFPMPEKLKAGISDTYGWHRFSLDLEEGY